MNQPDNHMVARYVLGLATSEESQRVEDGSASDADFAAKVAVLRVVAGQDGGDASDDDDPPGRQIPRRRQRLWWRAAAVAGCLWLGAGLTWAGWKLLATPPLLADDFKSGWGDGSVWRTPRRSVFFENGHARLFDRGYLVTVREFMEPIELRFRWKWIDLAGDLLYRDELAVALRTRGVPPAQHAFEPTDGLIVRFNASAGFVEIRQWDTNELFALTAPGTLPLAADQWYEICITDDGETVSVFVTGPGQQPGGRDRPLARVTVPAIGPRRHIAFFNRERLAAASHESWLDDVVIRALEPR